MQVTQLLSEVMLAGLFWLLGLYHIRMRRLRAQDDAAPPVIEPQSWKWAPRPRPASVQVRELVAMGPEEAAKLVDARPEVPERFAEECREELLGLPVRTDVPNRLWADRDVQTMWRVWSAGQRLACEACGRFISDNPLCPWCSHIQSWGEGEGEP